jgi:hypothetical protein
MRENRLSGSMQGRRETAPGTDNCGQFNPSALARLLYWLLRLGKNVQTPGGLLPVRVIDPGARAG